MKGIENLTKVALWSTQLITEIDQLTKKKKGKKVTGWIALKFLDNIFQAIPIIMNYKEIGAEFEDLDDNEKQQLNALIKQEIDLKDDLAEEFVERIFYLIIEIGDTIDFYIQSKK
tara:strand:- start:2077 stop:2421 length:345 start_codon:yes stop_codon:yes gene_type:complete